MLLLAMSGIDQLLAIINAANSRSFTADQLELEDPLPLANYPTGQNTRINFTANRAVMNVPGSSYVNYTRHPISELVQGDYRIISVPDPVESTHDLIPYLNDQLGMQFTERDIIDEPIDNSSIPLDFTLRITPVSYGWTGTVPMTISAHLTDLVTVNDLNALPLPIVPVKAQNSATVTNNGNLWAGTGISTSKLMAIANEELEIILGGHRRATGQVGYVTMVDPDVDGNYQFTLDNDKHWNWAFQVALKDTDRQDRLTEAYDLKMTVSNGTETLVFDLIWTGQNATDPTKSNYSWIHSVVGQQPIQDNGPLTSEHIVANSQQVRWYASAFPSSPVNGVGALLGSFTVTITATPIKCAVVRPVEISTTITVTTTP